MFGKLPEGFGEPTIGPLADGSPGGLGGPGSLGGVGGGLDTGELTSSAPMPSGSTEDALPPGAIDAGDSFDDLENMQEPSDLETPEGS